MQLVACGTEKGSQKPRKATLFLPCAGYKLHVFSFARKLFVTTIKFPPKRSANAVKCCSKKRLHRGMNGRILYTTLWGLLGEKHRCSYVLTFAGFVPHPHPPTSSNDPRPVRYRERMNLDIWPEKMAFCIQLSCCIYHFFLQSMFDFSPILPVLLQNVISAKIISFELHFRIIKLINVCNGLLCEKENNT